MAQTGLRALARTSAERALLSRIELTGFLRNAATLHSADTIPEGGSALWVRHKVLGVPVGVAEGVLLAREAELLAIEFAERVAELDGSNIVALTAVHEDEIGKPDSQDESFDLSATLRVSWLTRIFREVLPLASDHEETLAGFGRHTRRNLRNARKLAGTERITFEFTPGPSPISSDTLTALAQRTEPHAIRGSRIRGFEAYANQTGQPFRSTLKSADGSVISYCCGFFDPHAAYLVYQLNDRDCSRLGPSLMHRAFLIEALIQRGCSELVFIHGCSGILQHACTRIVADQYWITRRTQAARLTTTALARLWPDSVLGKATRAALKIS